MSTLKTTYLQHPSSPVENFKLAADGTAEVYDGSAWKAVGAGVVAVETALLDSTFSASLAAGVSTPVTGLSVTHALANASNRLFIFATLGVYANSADRATAGLVLASDGTPINIGAAGSALQPRVTAASSPTGYNSTYVYGSISVANIYSPGDTSSHTYTVEVLNARNATATVYVNRNEVDTNSQFHPRSVSSLTLMEVSV